jgi:hypothetical protein
MGALLSAVPADRICSASDPTDLYIANRNCLPQSRDVALLLRFVDANFCVLLRTMRHGEVKAIEFRHKQRRPGASCGRYPTDRLIVVGIPLFEDINETLASRYVYALSRRIVEGVIRIAHSRQADDCLAGSRVQND